MKHAKNPNVYRARMSGLRVNSFGLECVLGGEYSIEVYESRANPSQWDARPESRHTRHWTHYDPAELMKLISPFFATCLEPWHLVGKPTPQCPDACDRLPAALQTPWGRQPAAPEADSARLRGIPESGGVQ